MPPTSTTSREPVILLAVCYALLAISALGVQDRFTWFLEVAPILIATPVLIATRGRFPLTPLVYRLLLVHSIVLMVGGHYTYAKVPIGFWVQHALGLARNHYDRLGHLAQGFIPAMLVRELLVRRSPLRTGKWLFFLVTCVCLAISAFYEFIEWWTALATGEGATAFLGTQGDPWDTHWDMFMAMVGALTAQLVLSRVHDRQIAALNHST